MSYIFFSALLPFPPPPLLHSPLILTVSIYSGDLWQWFLRYWTSDNKDNGLLRSDQQIWQTQYSLTTLAARFKKVELGVWGGQADIHRVSKAHGKWNHHCSQEGKWSEHTEPRKEETVPFAVASHRIKYIDFNLTKVLKTCTLQIGKYCCRKGFINKWKSILYSSVGM